jgi:3-deoxy-D-manno-octulosonic-acid transferase
MVLGLYSCALFLVLVLGMPYWLLRMASSGKYREGLSGRLGRIPPRLLAPAKAGQTIWMHAVSVGEVLAAASLIKELHTRAPELRVVLSTTTRTGQRLARERVGEDCAFYYPLDFAWIVRRYLAALRPGMIVLVETEFWPNALTQFGRAKIPVVVVNGRISDRSYHRYLRLQKLWKRILANLTLVLAQSEQDVERLRAIGVAPGRVFFGGNLKFDVRAVKDAPVTSALRANLPKGARVLVCGSTMEGEEELLLAAFREIAQANPKLIMVLAPRHPERFDRVAELLRSRKQRFVRRSQWIAKPAKLKLGTVVLLDSIGELASVYSLASVAFVGGSLTPNGGHNPLEPAQFGVPVVMGPHYENFRAIVNRLLEAEALKIAQPENLVPMLALLLQDQNLAAMMGVRGMEVFDNQTGATDRAAEAILGLLNSPRERASAARSDAKA